MIRFGKRGKLNSRNIGPFDTLDEIGHLKLPQELDKVHDIFHVSNLKKCLSNDDLTIPFDEIQFNTKLHLVEERNELMDRDIKRLKQRSIPIVKV